MIVAITFSEYTTTEFGRSRLHDPRYLEAQEWAKVAAALNWEYRHLELPCDMQSDDHDRTLWLSVRLGELRREVDWDREDSKEMRGRIFVWVGAEGCPASELEATLVGRWGTKMKGPWVVR